MSPTLPYPADDTDLLPTIVPNNSVIVSPNTSKYFMRIQQPAREARSLENWESKLQVFISTPLLHNQSPSLIPGLGGGPVSIFPTIPLISAGLTETGGWVCNKYYMMLILCHRK